MKFNAYASLFRTHAVKQDSTAAVPTAQIVLFSNSAKDYVASRIVAKSNGGDDYFSMVLRRNLVENQREYSFPVDTLKNIKILEAYLDGKWKRLDEMDLNMYRLYGRSEKPYDGKRSNNNFAEATTDEAKILEQFTNENPMFDIDGTSVVIYSGAIEAVTAGLKMRAMIYPDDYTDANFSTNTEMSTRATATSTSMPRPSHEVILRKAVIDYKEAKGITLSAFDKNYLQQEELMMESLNGINLDESFISTTPSDEGFNY